MNKTGNILILSCMVVLYACTYTTRPAFRVPAVMNDNPEAQLPPGIPPLIQSYDYMMFSGAYFVGKFAPADTIHLDAARGRWPDHQPAGQHIPADGLNWIADYSQSVIFPRKTMFPRSCYYPVFVVNCTERTRQLRTWKNEHIPVWQEALDSQQVWRPIEYNSLHETEQASLLLYPGEFALILVPKYRGPYTTSIRACYQNDTVKYCTQAFTGSINYGQFDSLPPFETFRRLSPPRHGE